MPLIDEQPLTASPSAPAALHTLWSRLRENPLARVGPGLITGVADDDPSGIATYSQAGSQFGLNMLWTMPLALPLMAAVQVLCARIGRVTGQGLAANIKQTFPPVVLSGVVVLLLIANILNIAADVPAMGECAELLQCPRRSCGPTRRSRDLIAVEMQDRQHGAVIGGIEEFDRRPRSREQTCLGLAIADSAGDNQVWIVKRGPEGVNERIAQFTALVDRPGVSGAA